MSNGKHKQLCAAAESSVCSKLTAVLLSNVDAVNTFLQVFHSTIIVMVVPLSLSPFHTRI